MSETIKPNGITENSRRLSPEQEHTLTTIEEQISTILFRLTNLDFDPPAEQKETLKKISAEIKVIRDQLIKDSNLRKTLRQNYEEMVALFRDANSQHKPEKKEETGKKETPPPSDLEAKIKKLQGELSNIREPSNPPETIDFYNTFTQLKEKYDELNDLDGDDIKKGDRDFRSSHRELKQAFDQATKLAERAYIHLDPSIENLHQQIKNYPRNEDKFIRRQYHDGFKSALEKAEEFSQTHPDLIPIIKDKVENLIEAAGKIKAPEGRFAFETELLKLKHFNEYMNAWFFEKNAAENTRLNVGSDALRAIRLDELKHYDNIITDLKFKKAPEEEIKEAQQAKEDAIAFMDVLSAMINTGVFHDSSIPGHSLGIDGRFKANEKGEIEVVDSHVLAKKFIGGNTMGQDTVKNFNALNLIKSQDNSFDFLTQRTQVVKTPDGKEKLNGPPVGALQEIIALIYSEHLSKRGDEYGADKFYFGEFSKDRQRSYNQASDKATIRDPMMDLIDLVAGKNKAELEQMPDSQIKSLQNQQQQFPPNSPEYNKIQNQIDDLEKRIRPIYENIQKQLKHHSDSMFEAFKFAIKFKIARDDLSTLAVYGFSANTDASLPPGIAYSSFGRMQNGIRQLSKQSSSGSGYLVICSDVYDMSKVFSQIPPTEDYKTFMFQNGKDASSGYTQEFQNFIQKSNYDIRKSEGSLYDPKFNIMPNLQRLREEVDFPQLKNLRSQTTYIPRNWAESGVPPASFAMNNANVSALAWINADNALQTLYGHRIAGSEGKSWWDFSTDQEPNNEGVYSWAGMQNDMNTQMSIITGFTRGKQEGPIKTDPLVWWEQRKKDWDSEELRRLTPYEQQMRRVEEEAMSVYLSTVTRYIIDSPIEGEITKSDSKLIQVGLEARKTAVIKNAGEISGKALDKALFLPILKNYIESNSRPTDKFAFKVEGWLSVRLKGWSAKQERSREFWARLQEYDAIPEHITWIKQGADDIFTQLILNGRSDNDYQTDLHRTPPPLISRLTRKNMWKTK